MCGGRGVRLRELKGSQCSLEAAPHGRMAEPYLEKATKTGRLIVPSKLGAIPEEAYDMNLNELSLAGKAHRTVFLSRRNGREQGGTPKVTF
eukprot:COSAG02_NODE_1598_length_11761_cov_15.902418_8_plen_91_part_00